MSYEEIVENSRTLIVGGAETTATLLTGLIYYLGSFHHMLLRNLIRMAFSSAERITLEGLKIVEEGDRRKPEKAYIDACIYEALRMFPPLPGNLRRVVPEGGKIIAGRWVPGGTLVAVAILAANLSTRNFHRPNEFRPERWFKAVDPTTKHAAFDGDKLNVVQAVRCFLHLYSHSTSTSEHNRIFYLLSLLLSKYYRDIRANVTPQCYSSPSGHATALART